MTFRPSEAHINSELLILYIILGSAHSSGCVVNGYGCLLSYLLYVIYETLNYLYLYFTHMCIHSVLFGLAVSFVDM